MTRSIAALAFLALATCGYAQVAPNFTATEVFIVISPSATFHLDNCVVVDANANPFTFDMVLPASSGNGIYGPLYVHSGTWIMEPLWLTNTATGFTAGHMHINTGVGGNPSPFENSHAQGLDYQGFRIARVDGAQFQLASIDYNMSGASGLLIGTSYANGWATIAQSWMSIDPTNGLVPGTTTWQTYNFTVIPADVKSIRLDSATNAIAFNTTAGTFSVSSTITSYVTANDLEITDPAFDPIIGATINITGNYFGADIQTLSGIFLPNIVMQIAVNPNDQMQNIFSAFHDNSVPDASAFGGSLGAAPIFRRPVTQNSPSIPTRFGAGSVVLDILAAAVVSEPLTLLFALEGGSPRLYSIEKSYTPGAPQPEARFRTNGAGSAQLGIIGVQPGSHIYNVVAINPPGPVGTGAFFGLFFTGDQALHLAVPLGVQPFHVMASLNGTYFYGVPTGTMNLGLTVDIVSVAVTPSNAVLQVSEPQRIVF